MSEQTEAGYTLVEALVALTIIGLTLTGIMAAVRVVSQIEHTAEFKAKNADRNRRLFNGLDHLIADQGPFVSSQGLTFIGGPENFNFDCGQSQLCDAEIFEGAYGSPFGDP